MNLRHLFTALSAIAMITQTGVIRAQEIVPDHDAERASPKLGVSRCT